MRTHIGLVAALAAITAMASATPALSTQIRRDGFPTSADVVFRIARAGTSKCLDTNNGAWVLAPCGHGKNQRWQYNPQTKALKNKTLNRCIARSGEPSLVTCDPGEHAQDPLESRLAHYLYDSGLKQIQTPAFTGPINKPVPITVCWAWRPKLRITICANESDSTQMWDIKPV